MEKRYFKNEDGSELMLLVFPELDDLGIVNHAFSTRQGGSSSGPYADMNLGTRLGDDPENVAENFRRIARALGTKPEKMTATQQTHTINVRIVTEADAGRGVAFPQDMTDIDGLITNVPGICLAAFAADCVPLYFVDPAHKAIGLSHSGWKGTAARMGLVTIEKMRDTFASDPADMICAIGPSICKDCYEVSEDVARVFKENFPGHESEIMSAKGGGKYDLDLHEANRIILKEAGVKEENICVTDVCTCCNTDILFSHRVMGWNRGNNGAFLMLK